jgi:hypothetical protein
VGERELGRSLALLKFEPLRNGYLLALEPTPGDAE